MPHPSDVIRGGRSRQLEGRRIILGVAGSIAAVEAPRIARELIRHGADVVAVMSREATRIVTTEAMAFATGHPVVVELTGDVEHVTLLGPGKGRADLLLIAPATANTLSKIAHGIDDTPVTSCASVALGGGVPILLAPAMHAEMGKNPAIRENLARLRGWGVGVIDPVVAENEEKIPSPEAIAAAVLHRLASGPWAGRRLVVIGGASREPIDAVRSVTNESSGATAVALATEAFFRGAEVELWAGAIHGPVPGFFPVHSWRRVTDLLVLARSRSGALRSAAAIVVPAALSDFTLEPRAGKISSQDAAGLSLSFSRAPRVLPELRKLAGARTRLIGFKLEVGADADHLARRAQELMETADLDAVVANEAAVLGSDGAEALWVDRRGARRWLRGSKSEVAVAILEAVGAQLPPDGAPSTAPSSSERPHRRGPSRVRRTGPATRRRRGPRSS